jgi:hypothetical protein
MTSSFNPCCPPRVAGDPNPSVLPPASTLPSRHRRSESPVQPVWLIGMPPPLPLGAASRGSRLLVHDIKLSASTLSGGAGWWISGFDSCSSSERAEVAPLVSPTGRQHLPLQPRWSGVGHFLDGSDAPLIGEASCDAWRCLRLRQCPFNVASRPPFTG